MNTAEASYYQGRRVWIIGASTGIGRALAIELASCGASVVASARNEKALLELASKFDGAAHGGIRPLRLDIAQEGELSAAIQGMVETDSLPDIAIFMAGYYQPLSIHKINSDDLRQTLEVNLWAAMEFVRLITPPLYARRSGQIVLVGSVAGYRGLPKGQPYSATKAALINLAETLYLEAMPEGVDVKLLSPGFVETPLTDKNDFEMPDIISTEEAASTIAQGLQEKAFEVHFPKRFTRKLKFLRILPYRLYFKLLRKL